MDEGSSSGLEEGRRGSGQLWHPAPEGTGSGSDLDIESGQVEPEEHCSLMMEGLLEAHSLLMVEVGVDHRQVLEARLRVEHKGHCSQEMEGPVEVHN